MSAKISVTPYAKHLRDAVELGLLQSMIEALYSLGYDEDTPVTYLFDDQHVYLETVDDSQG